MANQNRRIQGQIKASITKPKAGAKAPVLLLGGNARIAKADGDAPVRAYIAAMPGWKRAIGKRLDALIVRNVPNVRKAVKWNSPMYGMEGQGLFLGFHAFTHYVKVTFFRGTSLRPVPPAAFTSAGKNNAALTSTAAVRVDTLTALAQETRATPDQYDKRWRLALGTLGGGNHFIELAEDLDGTVWVTLHSGSRGVGNRIGTHYIKVAQELSKKMGVQLPDRGLAYLPEEHPACAACIRDLNWAQQFAFHNRNEMMDRVLTELSHSVFGKDGDQQALEVQRIDSHHNFTQKEHHCGEDIWVTRKGAIKATKESWAMIPGSMGTRSYIVVGKENPMSVHSAPHGAGRRYSRTKARSLFSMDDLRRAMEGIEYRHSKVLLDEIPGAYKDIDQVMENAKELVDVKYILKQFVNVKGD